MVALVPAEADPKEFGPKLLHSNSRMLASDWPISIWVNRGYFVLSQRASAYCCDIYVFMLPISKVLRKLLLQRICCCLASCPTQSRGKGRSWILLAIAILNVENYLGG